MVNMATGAFIAGGLFFSTYNLYCLAGNGEKIEGYSYTLGFACRLADDNLASHRPALRIPLGG
jgi:hypothetical protein